MTSFEIKPNTFFKSTGLEDLFLSKKVQPLKTSASENSKAFFLWINTSKPWSFSIFTSFNGKDSFSDESWDHIHVEPGVIFYIEFLDENQISSIKDSTGNSLFKGPAKLTVQTKIPANNLEKTNLISIQEEKEDFFPLPLFTSKTGKGSTKSSTKTIMEKKVQNKAIQNTKNLFFLRQLKDSLQKEKYKVFISLRGIGYRVFISEDQKHLNFKLGYTHPIKVKLPTGISAISSTDRSATVGGGENQFLTLISLNHQKLTQFANLLVSLRPPEPQKGKGILIRTKKGDLRRQNLAKKLSLVLYSKP